MDGKINKKDFQIEIYSDGRHRDQVIALWENVFEYTTAAHNRPAVSIDKKLGVNDGLFFVAVHGTTVVGTVMAGYDGHRGWIYSLAAAAAYRKQGIGSALLGHAEKMLEGLGCLKVNLQIMEGNESVEQFYAKNGYSTEKRISMGKRLVK